ncbi:MAG: hypothetical protein ABI455_08960 [Candidatus Dormiibacterota bacterium]
MEGDVVWHRGQTLAAGQVVEFKVWAELIRQSTGGLHVFLPLRDLGIDGVLHRLSDGSYVPVQVKGRMELTPAGQVHITVTASSLVDDDAFMIATLVDGDRLGSMVLVVDEATFRSLSASDVVEGREYLTAAFELHAGGTSRWTAYLVPREKLAERFGTLRLGAHGEALEVGTRVDRGREGFLGEAEVIRRLAEGDSLNLFRPFPDLETVEVLVRHIVSRRFLGLQVKTAGWDTTHAENRIYVRRSSFRPAPSTFVCVLGLERKTSSFAGDCLLIPSSEIASLARIEGEWMVLELEPQSVRHRRLDSYRTPLASLASTVDAMLV